MSEPVESGIDLEDMARQAESVGRLSRMFIDNAALIEEVIEDVGASAVAEFFINAGTAMVVNYNLIDDDKPSTTTVENGVQ